MRKLGAILILWAVSAAAQTLADCRQHRHYGRLDQAGQCFAGLLASPDSYQRAEGYWGLERYTEANDQFRLAVDAQPKNPDYRVRWGRLYLERFQKADAAQLFQEALKIDENHTGAMLGLALVASEGFEATAVELAEAALKADPKLVEARELLAFLALEDGDEEKAIRESEKALELSEEALEAMAIRAAIDWMDDKAETPWMDRILRVNAVYGEAYATAAHFFVLNRRYEEGIEFYLRALELNPRLWKARSALGVNLMRLGQEQEARVHLEQCYDNDYKSYATVNTLRLMDSYSNFQTFTTETAILRLHQQEAELLRPYFEAELRRAIETYSGKYKLELPGPVQLEVYPDHEDFAVRTLGMPGLGALGVTFGNVVAMDSPSGRPPGAFHWASTLWHELSHVYVLAATNHRVPRWFTEGMAVHEETAVSSEWGDRLDALTIAAIKEKKLLPVATLDRGFIRPSYAGQVGVSYFQAGRICDYINGRWGYDKLLDMMHAFGEKKTTPQVVQEHLGMMPEEFDTEFLAWLEEQTKTTVEGFDEWKKQMKALMEAADAGRHDEVIRDGPAARDIYPEYVEAASAYELIAEAHLEKENTRQAAEELERYARAGGRNPVLLKKLAKLQQEQGRTGDAAETLERLIHIYPVNDEELHRRLGELWLGEGNIEAAIREYRAVVAMKPLDQAASQFNLAKAYRAAEKNEQALEHVVQSLEAAPGYRPAQKMLLELSAAKEED